MRRLLVVTGSRNWIEGQRIHDELAAYSPAEWDLMHGACPDGADAIANDVALEMGWQPGETLHRRPANWRRWERAAGPRRNREMAAEVTSGRWSRVEGLAFGSRRKLDGQGQPTDHPSGTGHMVALLRSKGLRVRWIPSPEAETEALSLRVRTCRIQRGAPPHLDITRQHGGAAGAPFAPSWEILKPAIEKRRRAQAIGGSEGEALEDELWAEYVPQFLHEMRASWRGRRAAWTSLLALDEAILGCLCARADHCHRTLVAQILERLGAINLGEIEPAQGRIPGV